MHLVEANGITINYLLESPHSSTTTGQNGSSTSSSNNNNLIILINGLADDLTTWSAQLPALHAAGYTTLRYDNRGIGHTSRPAGPYTADLLAADLHALLCALETRSELHTKTLHLLGVSMGGMVAQAYALRFPNGSSAAQGWTIGTLMLCCTYAQPTTFCSRMFSLWEDMAQRMSVQDVMRDVTLWAFTVPFFRRRPDELEEVEKAMRELDMGVDEYLAQLSVIQRFDSTPQLDGLKADEKVLGNLEHGRVLVLAGQTDLLIPVVVSRELFERVEGARWGTVKGGHGCMWEFPDSFNKAIVEFLDDVRAKEDWGKPNGS